MKKLLISILILALLFCLSGCSVKEAVSSDRQEYFISAIGFDSDGDSVTAIAEAIIINSEDANEEKKTEILYAKGNTASEAFGEIYKKATQPLMLSHCTVIAIGSEITQPQFKNICEFCYSQDRINLAAIFVSCYNAKQLLSCDNSSSIAVGYDISEMLQSFSEQTGIIYQNKFYEIEAALEKEKKISYIPYLNIEKKSFFVDGIVIFDNLAPVTTLDNSKTYILSLMNDRLSAGNFILNSKSIKVFRSSSDYDFDFDKRLRIKLNLNLKTSVENAFLSQSIFELFELSKKSSTDILGLANEISHQNPEIWSEIQSGYTDILKNSQLQVNFNG